MLKLTQNQYYSTNNEAPLEFHEGSTIFTSGGKLYMYPDGRRIEMSSGISIDELNDLRSEVSLMGDELDNIKEGLLKQMIISVSQSGSSAPSLTLIKNNTSLDFDNMTTNRSIPGFYSIEYPTSDTTLSSKLSLSLPTSTSTTGITDGTPKGGPITFQFQVYNLASGSALDNLLSNDLLIIYVNE